jgi:hypothetical protein
MLLIRAGIRTGVQARAWAGARARAAVPVTLARGVHLLRDFKMPTAAEAARWASPAATGN